MTDPRPRLRFALAALLGLALGLAPAAHAEPAADDPQRPLVVRIHADWCGTCTRLGPVWERLEAAYGKRAQLVVFDVTDRDAVARSREAAERLGLVEFFDDHKSRTGTVAVLGGDRKPVAVFKGETDFDRYAVALGRALGDAKSPKS